MNYKKYIYRRLDYLVGEAKDMLKRGIALTPEFPKALQDSEDMREHESLRVAAENSLRDSVRSYLGPQFVNVHVLVGYCPQTIPFYEQMIKELRKTFPRVQKKDVSLGKVKKSSYVKGFTLITCKARASLINIDGQLYLDAPHGRDYTVSEHCEYYW